MSSELLNACVANVSLSPSILEISSNVLSKGSNTTSFTLFSMVLGGSINAFFTSIAITLGFLRAAYKATEAPNNPNPPRTTTFVVFELSWLIIAVSCPLGLTGSALFAELLVLFL